MKVKAHTTLEDVEAGKITHEDSEGNDIADHWVAKGADEAQVSDEFARSVGLKSIHNKESKAYPPAPPKNTSASSLVTCCTSASEDATQRMVIHVF